MADAAQDAITWPGSHGEHDAQSEYGTTKWAQTFYSRQMVDFLSPLMQSFVATTEMMVVATSDEGGNCDASFRAGPRGFIGVIDDRTLAWPELRGNGVHASVGNIRENPHVGLILMEFRLRTLGLHVNGAAELWEAVDFLARDDVPSSLRAGPQTPPGLVPERFVLVRVEEAYIHCAKHMPAMRKVGKQIHWGTDDDDFKGGDAFGVRDAERHWPAPDPAQS